MHLCSTPHYPWDELGSKQGSLQCCLDPRPHVMSTHASGTRSKPPWLLLLQRGLRNPILLLVLPASLEVLPDAHCPMSCFQTSWHLGVFSMVPSLHCGHRSGSPLHKRMDVTDTHCLWISYHQIHPRTMLVFPRVGKSAQWEKVIEAFPILRKGQRGPNNKLPNSKSEDPVMLKEGPPRSPRPPHPLYRL